MELRVEAADHLRAAIVVRWEIEATSVIHLVWVTDCESTRSASFSPGHGKTDWVSRSHLFDKQSGSVEVGPLVGHCRWVDADCMHAGGRTDKTDDIRETGDSHNTNTWNVQQPL